MLKTDAKKTARQRLLDWFDCRFPIRHFIHSQFTGYYVPNNLNFWYSFGFILMLVLANQVITGLWLTMFYTPHASHAFDSIQLIMRDIPFGWLIRYLHTTGASFIFIAGYLHIFRSLLYGSYQAPRELVWLFGMILFFLLCIEAFLGYVLPWGQMSYWAGQVITSLLEVVPFVGKQLVVWVRGDYHMGDATLHRFFALHAIAVPGLIIGLVIFHLVALRQVGSNNPEGVEIKSVQESQVEGLRMVPFHPHYTMKDIRYGLVFLAIFLIIVFFAPAVGGYFLEPENMRPADPWITPLEIKPIWYLAPFYEMLRLIPQKLMGIGLTCGAIGVWLFLPWLDKSPVRSMRYKGFYSKVALGMMVIAVILLGYLGLQPLTSKYLWFGRFLLIIYWGYFLAMPIYSLHDCKNSSPNRVF